jgi:hypothetical protein
MKIISYQQQSMKFNSSVTILSFLLLCSSVAALAQADIPASITGKVIDAATKEPLVGATVRLPGTGYGGVTDRQGAFSIRGVPPGTYRVQISSIGYETMVMTDVIVTNVRPAAIEAELTERSVQGDEVVVRPDYFSRGSDAITSVQTLSNEEIRRLPGGFEDVVRAISTLPGVAQVSNGRNDLLVRGGAPSENLFLIDNIEAPNINHFGTQGAGGGPLSFVNLDFVREVTFSTGGFGAAYGDRVSSVLRIDLRNGREDRTGGKATISASQFGLNLEGPAPGDGTYLFSARRSYLDLIFRAAGFSFVPEYWDFLGKANYRLGSQDELAILAIGAIDRIRQFNRDGDDRFENSRILDNSQNQLVAGITWKHLFRGGYVNSTLGRTVVDYRFNQTDTLLVPVFTNNSTEDEFSLRLDGGVQIDESTELSFGGQGKSTAFDAVIHLNQPGNSLDIAPGNRFYKGALYSQIARTLFEGLRLNLGGRLDYFSGIEQQFYPSARLAMTAALDGLSSLNLSAGRYYQAPSYIWLAANADNRRLLNIRTDVAVVGIDRRVREDVRVSIEGYYKNYSDYPASLARPYLVLANTGAGFGGADDGFASFGLEPLASLGSGRSYGAELLLQKKLSDIRCYGIASLSYNYSLFTASDGLERPGNFDQRIIFNLSGGYQFDDEWELGLKFRFATGRPFTPVDPAGDPGFGYQVTSQYNALRLPPSHALDLRLDRRWPLSGLTLITYIDVQNIYNRKNPTPPRWNARTRTANQEENSIGILPSIGISAEF